MPEPQMEELDETQCRKLLADRHLGRLALVDAKGPVIVPVNYVLDGESPVFRTDPGSKLDAAAESAPGGLRGRRGRGGHPDRMECGRRGALAEVTDPDDLPFIWWG